jgi:hypothetical protein
MRCLTLVEEENLDRDAHIKVHVLPELFFVFGLAAVDGYGDGIVELFVLRNLNVELEGPNSVALGALRVGALHLNVVAIEEDFGVFEAFRCRNGESFLHGLVCLLVVTARHVHEVGRVDVDVHVDDLELWAFFVGKWRIVGRWIRVVTVLPWSKCKFDFRIKLISRLFSLFLCDLVLDCAQRMRS